MNNYEKIFEAVKNNYSAYEDLTFEEFLDSDDEKKREIFYMIENKALAYFEGRDIDSDFEEAFDSYFQEDNKKNNEFRDNFKKIFEFAIRKLKLGGLTFEEVLDLKENDARRVALRDFLDRVFKAYIDKKLDRNSMLYKAIDDFYKSDIFKEEGNDFKIKAPVTAESFFRYGSKFKVTTSKVRNENEENHENAESDAQEEEENQEENNQEEENQEEQINNEPDDKKEPNKVVNFLKDGSKTIGYTVLVGANALFGGLGAVSGIIVALGGNIFIPAWLPALAIGIPAATLTGIVIKNREKIKNKVKSIIFKIKSKFKIENDNLEEVNENQEEVNFDDLYEEEEPEKGDIDFSDSESINDEEVKDDTPSEDTSETGVVEDEEEPEVSEEEETKPETALEESEKEEEEPIETTFVEDKPEISDEEETKPEPALEEPKEEIKVNKETEKTNIGEESNQFDENRNKMNTKDYKNKINDLKTRLEMAKNLHREDWIEELESEISKLEKIVQERENKKQEITANKEKLVLYKERLEMAKKLHREDWINELEIEISNLQTKVDDREKIKQDFLDKKEKLENLKKQINYYKALGREDWVTDTMHEIEELSKQIDAHDDDLDYPNEDVSEKSK